jgi:hypothetical protein
VWFHIFSTRFERSFTWSTLAWSAEPRVEKLSMATFGGSGPRDSNFQFLAEAKAMSLNWEGEGATLKPQSEKI